MQIINREMIASLLEPAGVIDAVRAGFIAHSRGQISLPEPVQMVFQAPNNLIKGGNQIKGDDRITGDCHVKSAYSEAYPYFCIKVATGFYDNPALGLPVNNGMVMLMDAQTGAPIALLQDGGLLTSMRTAAAGALAAGLAATQTPKRLGIIGTGHQAELQARWISASMDIDSITLWGRSEDKAKALATDLGDIKRPINTVDNVAALAAMSDIIVTTTPSTRPILLSEHVRPGHHIIAMGADSPGKGELDPDILARADYIVVDDRDQCVHHGELGQAVRAGRVDPATSLILGAVLDRAEAMPLTSTSLSVVDLTGLGAQDLAIASYIYERISQR